jgi:hypothetical protein
VSDSIDALRDFVTRCDHTTGQVHLVALTALAERAKDAERGRDEEIGEKTRYGLRIRKEQLRAEAAEAALKEAGRDRDVRYTREEILAVNRRAEAAEAALKEAERERDEYRFWNERVRVCEHHTEDVAAPVGDCLICTVERLRRVEAAWEDALYSIANGRPNRRFDPWAREIATNALAAAASPREGEGE